MHTFEVATSFDLNTVVDIASTCISYGYQYQVGRRKLNSAMSEVPSNMVGYNDIIDWENFILEHSRY